MVEYNGVKYKVDVEDIREEPPFKNLSVEIWQEAGGLSDEIYSFQKVYEVTRRSEGLYLAEDVSDEVYGEDPEGSVLTREKGDTTELKVEDFQQEPSDFAEELIDSLDL
jgi:hypothetical protein